MHDESFHALGAFLKKQSGVYCMWQQNFGVRSG
eukprot:COSAG05_NODE_6486_length_948_cov_9.961796_1_plen_32_part_01